MLQIRVKGLQGEIGLIKLVAISSDLNNVRQLVEEQIILLNIGEHFLLSILHLGLITQYFK